MIILSIIKAMTDGSSEKHVKYILNHIDKNIWESITDKAISKMPKYKIAIQSEKMFDDFAILTNKVSEYASTPLKQQLDYNGQIHQNLLVGTSKLEPNLKKIPNPTETIEEVPKQKILKKGKLRSTVSFINQKIFEPEMKINSLFRVSLAENLNEQEQKHDQILRTTKYENMKYNQRIQHEKKVLESESEHRAHTQQKRFKELKQFTYDYDGRFVALNSNKNNNLKVLNMKHKFGNNVRSHSLGRNVESSILKISQISNKKIVGQDRMSAIQLMRQKEKEKDDKLNKYLNTNRQKINSFELFKDEEAVSIGVSITDLNTRQRFFGKIRDKGNNKNLNLSQYKNQAKYVESIKQRMNIKQRKSERYVTKTEYYQSTYDNNRRLKTHGTDRQSKVLTSLTRFVKNCGKIIIEDNKLYSQNFTEDFD